MNKKPIQSANKNLEEKINMLIRSQDKGSIRNFSLISDLVVSKNNNRWKIIACYPYFAQDDCGFSTIGEYSTEKKAIKVLDDICSFANGLHFEKIATDKCGRFDGVVFQMPKDNEVD